MKTRIWGLAALAFGFMMLATVGAASQNTGSSCQIFSGTNFNIVSATWGNATHLISAGPGMSDVPLTLSLESYGNTCLLQNVQGSISLSGGITNFDGSSTSTAYAQSVQPAQIFTMVFYLNIANTLATGPNTYLSYPFYLSWNYTNQTLRIQQEVNLNLPLKGSAQLDYNVASHGLPTGQLQNLTITVSNQGTGTLTNIATTVPSSSSLSVIKQPTNIASLTPGSSKNITALVYGAQTSTGAPLTLNLATSYINPYGYNTTLTVPLGLYTLASQTPAISVSASNESLLAGVVSKDSLVVTNNGQYPLDNVTAQLTPTGSMSLLDSDGFVSFPTVQPGQSATVPVTLYVTSSSSTVESLGVILSYETNGQSQSLSRTITLLTPGYINITGISTTVLPARPAPGSIFSLTVTLQNGGSVSASAATATAIPPNGIAIIGSTSTYIGSIPTGTPTAYTVSFTVGASTKAGLYHIPVVLSYLNNLNQKINNTYQYTVNVSGSAPIITGSSGAVVVHGGNGTTYTYTRGGGFPTGIVVVVIIIIVAAAGAYYYFRIYKKPKAAGKEQPHKKGSAK